MGRLLQQRIFVCFLAPPTAPLVEAVSTTGTGNRGRHLASQWIERRLPKHHLSATSRTDPDLGPNQVFQFSALVHPRSQAELGNAGREARLPVGVRTGSRTS